MSGLTTHVLNLTHGTPASNVTIELFIQEEATSKWKRLKTVLTNSNGRLDDPLLMEDEMKIGSYELVFHVGEYFQKKDVILPNPPFIDLIPVRFGISDVKAHYHVPLLISPWGYQVYRGS